MLIKNNVLSNQQLSDTCFHDNILRMAVAKSCFVPALFGHAIDDDFIQPHHSDRIYEAYVVSSVLVNEEHLKQYVYA